jgi:hypothetical protein
MIEQDRQSNEKSIAISLNGLIDFIHTTKQPLVYFESRQEMIILEPNATSLSILYSRSSSINTGMLKIISGYLTIFAIRFFCSSRALPLCIQKKLIGLCSGPPVETAPLMKCRICRCDLDEECVDDEIDLDIAHGQKNWICWNCWYDTTSKDR